MAKKALHTCVRVMDLDKSVDFYTNILGMEITKKLDYPDDKFTLVYLALPGDDYEVELTYNYDQKEPYEIGNGYGHIAISVDDLQATHEEYSKSQYEVTGLKGLSDGAANYFFIKDPDGYKIEVIQDK